MAESRRRCAQAPPRLENRTMVRRRRPKGDARCQIWIVTATVGAKFGGRENWGKGERANGEGNRSGRLPLHLPRIADGILLPPCRGGAPVRTALSIFVSRESGPRETVKPSVPPGPVPGVKNTSASSEPNGPKFAEPKRAKGRTSNQTRQSGPCETFALRGSLCILHAWTVQKRGSTGAHTGIILLLGEQAW
jgi:hypothetical protein